MFSAHDIDQLSCLFPFMSLCERLFFLCLCELAIQTLIASFPQETACYAFTFLFFAHGKKVPTASGRDHAEVIGASTFMCLLPGGRVVTKH